MNYIQSFSLREVFTVTGQPGLWKIKSYSSAMGIATMERLTNGKQIVRCRTTDLSPVESIRISTTTPERKPPHPAFTDPTIVTVATVFERIWDLEQSGTKIHRSAEFEKMRRDVQEMEMLLVVKDADLSQFLPTHFSKILKWYADLELAMSMLEPVVDPYDELSQEDTNDKA